MKVSYILIISLLLYFNTKGQKRNELIIGKWILTTIEATDSSKVSEEIQESFGKVFIRFDKNKKMTSTKITESGIITLGSGIYKISQDENILFQDEKQFFIIKLDKNELIFRASERRIIKFKRVLILLK